MLKDASFSISQLIGSALPLLVPKNIKTSNICCASRVLSTCFENGAKWGIQTSTGQSEYLRDPSHLP